MQPQPRCDAMIPVTRMNNQRIYLNPDLIESVEESGDTVLVLTNGHRLSVRECATEVVKRVVEYRKSLISGLYSGGPTQENLEEPPPLWDDTDDAGEAEETE